LEGGRREFLHPIHWLDAIFKSILHRTSVLDGFPFNLIDASLCNSAIAKKGRKKAVANVGTKGFKSQSKDGKFLINLLKKKEVSAGITPTALKQMYPQFQVYKQDSLGSGMRRLKAKYGVNVRSDSDIESALDGRLDHDYGPDEDLDTVASKEDGPPADIKVPGSAASKAAIVSQMMGFGAPAMGGGATIGNTDTTWKPIHLKTMVEDNQRRKHQLVVLCLPGGFSQKNSEGVEVSLDDGHLVVSCKWPDMLSDCEFFKVIKQTSVAVNTRMFNQLKEELGPKCPSGVDFSEDRDEYHVYLKKAFREEINEIQTTNPHNFGKDGMRAVTHIKLDINCGTSMRGNDWRYLGFKNGVRMIYIDIMEKLEQDDDKKVVREMVMLESDDELN